MRQQCCLNVNHVKTMLLFSQLSVTVSVILRPDTSVKTYFDRTQTAPTNKISQTANWIYVMQ